MRRQGPIPFFFHGVVEYLAAILFIGAPFLFGFDEDSAQAVSIVVGVLVLVLAASTDGPTGLAKLVPVGIHATFDLALAIFLIASPFLFGFDDESGATAFFIVLGVVHLLLTIGTRFFTPREPVESA
jgi:hypothetical protein